MQEQVKIEIRQRPNKPRELLVSYMAPDGSVYRSEPVTLDSVSVEEAVSLGLSKAQGRYEAMLEQASDLKPLIAAAHAVKYSQKEVKS